MNQKQFESELYATIEFYQSQATRTDRILTAVNTGNSLEISLFEETSNAVDKLILEPFDFSKKMQERTMTKLIRFGNKNGLVPVFNIPRFLNTKGK